MGRKSMVPVVDIAGSNGRLQAETSDSLVYVEYNRGGSGSAFVVDRKEFERFARELLGIEAPDPEVAFLTVHCKCERGMRVEADRLLRKVAMNLGGSIVGDTIHEIAPTEDGGRILRMSVRVPKRMAINSQNMLQSMAVSGLDLYGVIDDSSVVVEGGA